MPQGLDRVILISIESPGHRDENDEWVPGAPAVFRRWATRLDVSTADVEEEAGVYTAARRSWIVRWFRELAETLPNFVSVFEGSIRFNCTGVVEVFPERRRRFLKVEGVAVE